MSNETQIRGWSQTATGPQKRVTAGVAVIILLLAATVAVIASDDDATVDFAAVEASPDDGLLPDPAFGSAIESVQNPDGLESPDPLVAAPAVNDGAAPVTPTPAAPAATNPASVAPPKQSGGSAATPAPAGATGGAPAPSTTAAPPTTRPSVPLTASDRGVSETEITIGFLIINIAGIEAAGLALDLRTDGVEYAHALGEWVNKRGGVAGRKIKVVARKTDPANFSDQTAACQAMVNDHKVFGVIENGALNNPAAIQCVTVANKTPLGAKDSWTQEWIDRSGGMQVSGAPAIERSSVTWVRDLAKINWFDDPKVIGDEVKVVGILGDNCPMTEGVEEGVLRDELLAVPSVEKVVISSVDCSGESFATQPPAFVTQMRAEGVTHIFVAHAAAGIVLQTAENQGYRPTYTATDWSDMTADVAAANMQPQQFDRTIGISAYVYPKTAVGQAPYPGGEPCVEAAAEAGLEPFVYHGREAEELGLCGSFFTMLKAIEKVGPNPTRQAWATTIPTLGRIDNPLWGPATYKPGQTSGGNSVATIQWLADCVCWKALSESRPGPRLTGGTPSTSPGGW